MIASLHLLRRPVWTIRRELWRLRRQSGDLSQATFSRAIFPLELSAPRPSACSLGLFALWPDDEALERFSDSPTTRRWLPSPGRLALTLEPVRSHESSPGASPLGAIEEINRSGPSVHLTYSRPRPSKLPAFLYRNARVAPALRRHRGQLWAAAFVANLPNRELGTLSIWRNASEAIDFAYGPGLHRKAMAAANRGRFFEEEWTARFAVTAADGGWPGIDVASWRGP